MTQKELLYFEDATKHECNIISILEESINNLEDEKLVDFLDNELEKHNSLKEKLIKLMEDNANE